MLVYLAIVGAVAYGYSTLATAFVPEEDQGSFMTSVTLPAEATAERTRDVVDLFEKHVQTRPDIVNNLTIMGFGFSGSGTNTAMAFTSLKDWGQRSGSVDDEVNAATEAMAASPEGEVLSMKPPAIDELGTTSGFALRLQDRANHGEKALAEAAAQLTQLASQSKLLSDVRVDGLPNGPSVTLVVDRQKASALGVAYTTISDTLSGSVGSTYVNDFPRDGRLQQVIVQAEPKSRMQVDDILNLHVRSDSGKMVQLSEIVTAEWSTIPLQVTRYNGYPSLSLSGSAAKGVSSGKAMDEIEQLALKLPKGFAVEWTGQSLQERQSGAQAPMLMAFSFLIVFLVLAALYESWTIPLSVMLVVPLGILGAVIAVHIRGLENDVFFKVGLITLIGLSAKNAVLIVEFARKRQRDGLGLADAVVEAARLRLRPIVMTSLAFTLGVVPLVIASGASSETQNAIGTGLFGGMISGTVLAVIFVPVFYMIIMRLMRPLKVQAGSATTGILQN